MSIKFRFSGSKTDESGGNFQHLQTVQPDLQVKEYSLGTARSVTAEVIDIEADEKDIIELQLSNEVTWQYRADDFETMLKTQQPAARGGEGGVLQVPGFFASDGGTRGFADVLIPKSLKVITGWAAKQTAILLAKKMEEKLILGVHTCNEKMEFVVFDSSKVVTIKPYLLFIHGTNSSTYGAFKDLLLNDAYKKLYDQYGGRVIAFEHQTLSQSPLANITQLLTQLPDEMSLDIISHSRGGIVADLLARCQNGELPFNSDELKVVNNNDDLQILASEIQAANSAAGKKKLVINKMVRVACPAAGTVLISKKLDNYVNVFCNLIRLIPGADQAIPLTLFLDFAKAVVQERTDLKALPGLEAQMPESPFMKLLNNRLRTISSELYVISGDVESSGFWNTLKVFGTNLYFGEAHDLVVNSNSMFKGTYRSTIVKEHFEQESNVNHFNYFKNKSSQNALLTALIHPETSADFFTGIGATSDITIIHTRAITGKKPLVFVLPGILGSNLTVNDEKIWADYLSICSGALSKLQINADHVLAASVHAGTYNNLINYISSDFDVFPFPYDWRDSVTLAADSLADTIKEALNDPNRTIKEFHFITHSMGGLVFRAMIHLHPDIWDKILATKKTRVVMMGVPNEGSFATIRILLGKDSIIKKLALLDFIHPKKYLLDIFKEYPGLIQLLPASYQDIFDPEEWNKLQALNDEPAGTPSKKTLDKGLKLYDTIKNTVFDNDIFRYVAGQDDDTPEKIDFSNGKITFSATAEGDGRVPWNTIPSSLLPANIYYVPADHGSIPKYEPAFEGFKELLTKGTTTLLTNTKPSTRSAAIKKTMPDTDQVSVPSANEWNDAIMSNRELPRKKSRQQPIAVSVTNGDLIHSKYPVVVGHFTGDGIVKAEKYLNRALDLKLSEYHTAGNYPGQIGSHLVILNDNTGVNENMICKGAVVVGLGEFGTLTENRLVLSLTQAFLTLAIKYTEYIKNKKDNTATQTEFGISSLLVGSDFAGLRIDTSIKAILSAVIQANEKLEAMNNIIYQKINRIEIVEIYQYKAIQIGRIMNRFMQEDRFSHFKFSPPVLKIASGVLKLIPDDSQQENWHRLEISVVKKGDTADTESNKSLPILFTSITDKAHADEELLPTNRLIVDSLIASVAKYTQWNKEFSQSLYELLIPNDFKGYGSSLVNMVIIVDEETARYPWELLHDPNGISDKPMVINTGIVRQLNTAAYRKNVEMNTSNRALVIGNPNTGGKYPELPAAAKEAQTVLNILQVNGLETTDCIEKEDMEIIPKLLTKSYKVIHIASHGIVGTTINEPTGVILGKEIIFTAADFRQIRIVPEFVFVNSCSSNEYDVTIAQKMRRKYDLAASVGTQLIEMGVKAAIVTGWEINDQAAGEFSKEFYNQMFQGKGFGEAVHCARESTYQKYGQTNTWGAYQCYGDPFYTFKQNGQAASNSKLSFVDIVEVIYTIDNLINEITSASRRSDNNDYADRIQEIIDGLQPGWIDHPEIVEWLATLYKSLNQFEEAIRYYQKLFTLDDARYTVKSIEQYSNVRVRHAVKQFKLNSIDKKKAIQTIKDAVKDLEKIHGNTGERYSLIAASYRRLFEIDNDFKSLHLTAQNYQLAYQLAEENQLKLPYYPYFNWLHFALLLSDPRKKEKYLEVPKNIQEENNKALAFAAELDATAPDFFHKTAPSSGYLADLLAVKVNSAIQNSAVEPRPLPVRPTGKVITRIDKNASDIEYNFKWAWGISGKPSEKDTFINYLEFIISLLSELPAKNTIKLRDKKAKALQDLINRIR